MFQVATLVGNTLKEVISEHAESGQRADAAFNATMILGGQIGEGDPCLFLIYPEATLSRPVSILPSFRSGKPNTVVLSLFGAYDPEMSFEEAIKLLLVSFDSTIKANLSVSLPVDVHAYEAGSLMNGRQFRIHPDDVYFEEISRGWGYALREAFGQLPDFTFPA